MTFPEAVDERAGHEIGSEANKGEGGDEKPRGSIPDAERPGVERQDRQDHPEADHDEEGERDDRAHGPVGQDETDTGKPAFGLH